MMQITLEIPGRSNRLWIDLQVVNVTDLGYGLARYYCAVLARRGERVEANFLPFKFEVYRTAGAVALAQKALAEAERLYGHLWAQETRAP